MRQRDNGVKNFTLGNTRILQIGDMLSMNTLNLLKTEKINVFVYKKNMKPAKELKNNELVSQKINRNFRLITDSYQRYCRSNYFGIFELNIHLVLRHQVQLHCEFTSEMITSYSSYWITLLLLCTSAP